MRAGFYVGERDGEPVRVWARGATKLTASYAATSADIGGGERADHGAVAVQGDRGDAYSFRIRDVERRNRESKGLILCVGGFVRREYGGLDREGAALLGRVAGLRLVSSVGVFAECAAVLSFSASPSLGALTAGGGARRPGGPDGGDGTILRVALLATGSRARGSAICRRGLGAASFLRSPAAAL